MKTTLKYIAPALGAAVIGAASVPYVLGYHVSNHDESYTTNGQVDLPF